jgi:hypothetical protein
VNKVKKRKSYVFWLKEKPKMKKRLVALAGVVAACVLLAIASNVMATDANSPKGAPNENKLVIGIVTVTKDNNSITEIKVQAHRDVIYQVVLDDEGIKLGKAMADKMARIEGPVETKDKTLWLTVKTFGEPKHGTPAKPNQNPKGKPPAKPAKPAKPKY